MNPNTKDGSTGTRIRSDGVRARNACHLVRYRRLASPTRSDPHVKFGTFALYPFASSYSAARVDRASAPPKLHRQHFARSSYRCGITLTGSCNSIFKDEHPGSATTAPISRPERAPRFTTLGPLRQRDPGSDPALSSVRRP